MEVRNAPPIGTKVIEFGSASATVALLDRSLIPQATSNIFDVKLIAPSSSSPHGRYYPKLDLHVQGWVSDIGPHVERFDYSVRTDLTITQEGIPQYRHSADLHDIQPSDYVGALTRESIVGLTGWRKGEQKELSPQNVAEALVLLISAARQAIDIERLNRSIQFNAQTDLSTMFALHGEGRSPLETNILAAIKRDKKLTDEQFDAISSSLSRLQAEIATAVANNDVREKEAAAI